MLETILPLLVEKIGPPCEVKPIITGEGTYLIDIDLCSSSAEHLQIYMLSNGILRAIKYWDKPAHTRYQRPQLIIDVDLNHPDSLQHLIDSLKVEISPTPHAKIHPD